MSKSILVIDDSETNLILLEAVLEEAGFSTILAKSATEGFKILKTKKPSLILLDILMPKRSGIDFLQEMRKESLHNDIPVFVITAASDELKSKVMEFGVAGYFTKPIDIYSICDRVKDILEEK